MRQLAEGLGGYEGPMFPPSLREQGGNLEVSLQGWLGPGHGESCPLVTHITEEGPPPRSGAQGQWATEAAGDEPNRALSSRGPGWVRMACTEQMQYPLGASPLQTWSPSPASHCHHLPEKATLLPLQVEDTACTCPRFRVAVTDVGLSSGILLSVEPLIVPRGSLSV